MSRLQDTVYFYPHFVQSHYHDLLDCKLLAYASIFAMIYSLFNDILFLVVDTVCISIFLL